MVVHGLYSCITIKKTERCLKIGFSGMTNRPLHKGGRHAQIIRLQSIE